MRCCQAASHHTASERGEPWPCQAQDGRCEEQDQEARLVRNVRRRKVDTDQEVDRGRDPTTVEGVSEQASKYERHSTRQPPSTFPAGHRWKLGKKRAAKVGVAGGQEPHTPSEHPVCQRHVRPDPSRRLARCQVGTTDGSGSKAAATWAPASVSRYRCRGGRPSGWACSHAASKMPRSSRRASIGYNVPDFNPVARAKSYPYDHCPTARRARRTALVCGDDSRRRLAIL
jgi:hypothetical protein